MKLDVNSEWANSLSSKPRKTYGYYLVEWMVSQCGLFKEDAETMTAIDDRLNKMEISELFHTLWTRSQSTPGYQKQEWMVLESKISTLNVERDEARKQVVELTAQQTEYDRRVEQLSDHLEVAEAELERHKAGWVNALALLGEARRLLRRWAFPDGNVPWDETKRFLGNETPTLPTPPRLVEANMTQQEIIEAALFAAVRVEFKVFASGGTESLSLTLQGQSIEDLRRKVHLFGELMKLKSLLAE